MPRQRTKHQSITAKTLPWHKDDKYSSLIAADMARLLRHHMLDAVPRA